MSQITPREVMNRVFNGELDNLPKKETHQVRIFISSTFTDFAEERNLLFREVIPELRQHCNARSLDLQIADMRWGVRDDAQNDHRTTKIVLREVENCQRLSMGPNFVALLGNRYGSRSFPSEIEAEEFKTLLNAAFTISKNVKLLAKWFKLDENAVPPAFVLQPITSQFPYYNDESEENSKKRDKDRKQWGQVNDLLTGLFRAAAQHAYKTGHFTAEQRHKYLMSVTESEVLKGIVNVEREKANQSTLCFRRQLDDIDLNSALAKRFIDLDAGTIDEEAASLLADLRDMQVPDKRFIDLDAGPIDEEAASLLADLRDLQVPDKRFIDLDAGTIEEEAATLLADHRDMQVPDKRFIDLDAGTIDEEAASLLADLRDMQVPDSIQADKIYSDTITWDEKGVNPEDYDHQRYLNFFKTAFLRLVGGQILDALQRFKTVSNHKELYVDVLHHLHHTKMKSRVFVGRVETLNRIQFKLNKTYFWEAPDTEGDKKDDRKAVTLDDYLLDLGDDDEEDADPNHSEFYAMYSEENRQKLSIGGVAHELDNDCDVDTELAHQIMSGLRLRQYSKPLIIHGPSGSGKTALMAQIAKLSATWFSDVTSGVGPVRVIRFCGTTPASSTIFQLLSSICMQIRIAFDISGPSMSAVRRDFAYLVEYFKSLLLTVPASEERPLVVVIDSIDQLRSINNPYNMHWLPRKIKPNVYLVVSFIPTMFSLLDNCKSALPDEDRYYEIPSLPRDTGAGMLKILLKDAKRSLIQEQHDVLLAKLRMCAQPLFLKLCFEEARHWHSYTPRDDWTLGITVRSVIEQMFIRLEIDHGPLLVSKALSYMTVTKQGVTDSEMEDLLSLEDAVLQDTYLYHLPPDPTVIRIPPLMWARLKLDLEEYLVEYQNGAKTITNWYHRQFSETVEKRYLSPEVKMLLHSNLVDYFTGKWANQVKPITFSKKKYGVYNNATRGVPEMPCFYEKTAFNRRKLAELPYHLTACKRHVDFITDVCFDFNMLYFKCKALSVRELLNDLMEEKMSLEGEIQVILDREEEERKQLERMRKKRKAPDMETGKSAVKITDVSELEDEEFIENRNDDEPEMEGKVSQTAQHDIFQLTSILPLNKAELYDVLRDIEFLIDMLVLGFDSIQRDPDNFLSQVLGQVDTERPLCEGLADVRAQAQAFLSGVHIPLLAPLRKCMPSPGAELVSSWDVKIGFPGDAYGLENKITLSKDGKKLYVVERNPNTVTKGSKGTPNITGDFLRTHELSYNGLASSMETLMGLDVRKLQLVGGDRYFYVEAYKRRDQFNPVSFTCVLDVERRLPLPFTPDSKVFAFSTSGRYCLVVEPYYRADKPQTGVSLVATQHSTLGATPTNKASEDISGNEIATQTGEGVDHGVTSLQIASLHDLDTGSKTGLCIMALSNQKFHVTSGCFAPDEKLVVCQTKEAMTFCFQVERGKFMYKWGEPETLSFSSKEEEKPCVILPNNYLLQTGLTYKDSSVLYMRNLNSGDTIRDLQCGRYEISQFLVNTSRALVATCTAATYTSSDRGDDKDVFIWDLDKGDLVSRVAGRKAVNSMCFLGDEDQLMLVSTKGEEHIKIYHLGPIKKRLPTAVLLYTLSGHSEEVLNLLFSEPTGLVASLSKDNTLKLWSVPRIMAKCESKMADENRASSGGEIIAQAQKEKGVAKTTVVAISKDGKLAAVGTQCGRLLIFDVDSGDCKLNFKCSEAGKNVQVVLTTSDGRYFVSGGHKQPINQFDTTTGAHLRSIPAQKPVDCMAEGGGVLVCGQGGMECYGVCYELATGKVLCTLQGLYGFSSVVITSTGKEVISTFFDFPMVFSVETGEPKHAMGQPDSNMAGCTCLRVCPNNKLVAACSSDGGVRVMDIETGSYKFRMQHKSSVVAAAFDKNSASLVTAGFRNILVWNMRTGSLSHSLQRHQNFITSLQFSDCGRFLFSASLDKQIVVWDYELGASVAAYTAHCPVRFFSVARDAGSILYSPEDIASLAVVRPNPLLAAILKGEETTPVPESVVQAQSFALVFSGQKAKDKTSRACTIL